MKVTRADYVKGCLWEARQLGELARQWIRVRDTGRARSYARVAARAAMVVVGFRWSMASDHPVNVQDRGYFRPVTRIHSDYSRTDLSALLAEESEP